MAKETPKVQLISPPFRLNFPKLDVAVPYMEDGKPKGDPVFSTQMVFEAAALDKFLRAEGDSFTEVKVSAILSELAGKQWPGVALKDLFPSDPITGKNFWPLKKGDKIIEMENKKDKPKNLEYLVGTTVISAKSSEEYPCRLTYNEGGKKIALDRDIPGDMKIIKRLFKSGYWCRAELTLMAVEVNKNRYLPFYLNTVKFIKEGPSFGGSSLMDRFDGIDGGESDVDPTDQGDDF